MPAINFKECFVDDIISGKKRCTIRKKRKNLIKKGDLLYLYAGMRTKDCRLLLKTFCNSITNITITKTKIRIDGIVLDPLQRELLANEDGFLSIQGFLCFFENFYELPFSGQLIKW